MRLRGTLTALLLAAVLAASPASAGDPPGTDPQCVGVRTTGPIEAVVALEVERFGCETTVVLASAADCTGTPAEGSVQSSVGIVRVVVPHCGVPSKPSSAQWLPVCPDHRVDLGVGGEAGYWECEVRVHLVDDLLCTKLGLAPRENTVVEEGRVHVTYTTCTYPPHGPSGTSGPEAHEAGACVRDPGGDLLSLPDGCAPVTATCLGLEEAKQYRVDTRFGTVEANVCVVGPATGPPLAAAPPDCNGVWYFQETVGPVTYRSSGVRCTSVDVDPDWRPTCTPDRRDGAVAVERNEDCTHSVWIDAMSCPLAGSWKKVGGGPVSVHVYTCDAPTGGP